MDGADIHTLEHHTNTTSRPHSKPLHPALSACQHKLQIRVREQELKLESESATFAHTVVQQIREWEARYKVDKSRLL